MVSKNTSNNLNDDNKDDFNFDSTSPVGPETNENDSAKNGSHNANIDSTVGADGEEDLFVITDYDLVDPEDLKDHDLPGYPAVLDGSRFEALKNDIAQHGQQDPILVGDKSRTVYSGRSRRKACAELSLQVRVTYIKEAEGPDVAWASALQREWTLAEKARYVHYLMNDNDSWKSQIGMKKGDKTRDSLGRWLKAFRGWTTDVSGRQIDNFCKLAELLLQHPKAEAALVDQSSVAGAIRKLDQKPDKAKVPDPNLLIDSLATRLEKMVQEKMSNLSKDSRERLRDKLIALAELLRN